jgi:hypothetical protein
MMPQLIIMLLLCLFAWTASAQPAEEDPTTVSVEISSEDLKVVAELETLQLLELAEDLDMLKDINYLIEDDKNETQKK